jgi:hypothetical protein
LAAACPKLAESYRQDEATGTLLALAMCQEKSGQLASAWASFNGVVGRSEQEGRADRATAARAHVAALQPRLSRLTVIVHEDTAAHKGFEVRRDELALPQAAWGAPTPVDAGEHVIEATAPGHAPFRVVITIATEGTEQSVEIPALTPVLETPAASAQAPGVEPVSKAPALLSPSKPADRQRARSGSESEPSALRIAGFVAGGLGIVSLGVGVGFGIRAAHLNDVAIREGCDPDSGTCPEQALPLTEQLNEAGDLATGFVIAGSLLTVGGLVLYFVGGNGKPSARLGVSVLATGSGAGLTIQGML